MGNWEYWCGCCWAGGGGTGKRSVRKDGSTGLGWRCLGRLGVETGDTDVRLEGGMLRGVGLGGGCWRLLGLLMLACT